MSDRSFDALIVGGGPAGATATLLLARAGWNVCLLERKTFPRKKVCGEYLSATNGPLLEKLGIAKEFDEQAGPAVTRVALFAGKRIIDSPLPSLAGGWGRALSRERLDTLLVERAQQAGAAIWQPWSATALRRVDSLFHCDVQHAETRHSATITARVVLLAHGSWEKNSLLEPEQKPVASPSDLLAFKAHFHGGGLPVGTMPLLAFPGGYGGMVHGEAGRFSVSCCIRRDWLDRIRRRHAGTNAGVAVQAHLEDSMRGAQQAFQGATREGAWLAAGPIHPGVHLKWRPGVYPLGNVAGEAHPVIAEGISMAMQSAWLLVKELTASDDLIRIGQLYASSWRRAFQPRIRVAEAISRWAMSPLALSGSLPLLRLAPRLLTCGARLSGKVNCVVPLSAERSS
ncbi:MAG: NAD(P)/FAD-dependent oxidoreductase [Planctomycetes bacterium]|nr:NAD(P)/FAD-dependent oxidoreductase [Planctomycetota bacterium]